MNCRERPDNTRVPGPVCLPRYVQFRSESLPGPAAQVGARRRRARLSAAARRTHSSRPDFLVSCVWLPFPCIKRCFENRASGRVPPARAMSAPPARTHFAPQTFGFSCVNGCATGACEAVSNMADKIEVFRAPGIPALPVARIKPCSVSSENRRCCRSFSASRAAGPSPRRWTEDSGPFSGPRSC